MKSTASLTLSKAHTFLEQAQRADRNDYHAISTNIEAAIVFCRSVTLHLQKQFAHVAGFDTWYEKQREALRGQSLGRFLLDQRNYVLKVGPAVIHRIIGVSIAESVVARDELTVRIMRGQPWYRRSPRVLLGDLVYPLLQQIRIWRERRLWKIAAKKRLQPTTGIMTSDDLHFDDEEWGALPASQVIEQQLTILAKLVSEAEANFLPKDN